MKDRKLLEQFERAERKALQYRKYLTGSGIVPKLKRLLFLRGKYVVHILSSLGIKDNTTARIFFGKKMTLPVADLSASNIFLFGTLGAWESGLTKFFIKYIKVDDIFYDIGANHGFYTFLAKEIIVNGEIHAFEPNQGVFKYLELNSANGVVRLNNKALSNENGTVSFFDMLEAHHSGSSGLVKPVDGEYQEKRVLTLTLDEYTKTHKPPSIMKVDVEGAEAMVIEGGESTIRKYKPTIVIEVWSGERGIKNHSRAVKLLQSLGYRCFKIDDSGSLVPINSVNFDRINQRENFVFKNKDLR